MYMYVYNNIGDQESIVIYPIFDGKITEKQV